MSPQSSGQFKYWMLSWCLPPPSCGRTDSCPSTSSPVEVETGTGANFSFTMKKEDCLKIIINISLITLYIIFFGRMFFQKYISGGVVINNLEEKTHNISPPSRNWYFLIWHVLNKNLFSVIAFLTANDNTSSGWKSSDGLNCTDIVTLEDFKRCLEGGGYLFNETFLKGHVSSDHIYKVSSQYGLVHFLKPSPGAIGFLPEESLTIELNGHLCYFVIFYDPTFQILSENPTAVPKILLKIDEDKHGLHKIYLKVSPFTILLSTI